MLSGLTQKMNPFRKDPKEVARNMKSQIRSEIRKIDREIASLMMEQKKTTKDIKAAADRGDMQSAKILARGVVRLRIAVARQVQAKANLMALSEQLTQAVALSRVAGSVKLSTETMVTMNKMMKVPELQKATREMAREMYKTGMIEQSINDSVDVALGDEEEIEEATEEAIDQLLIEVAGEDIAAMAKAPSTAVPQRKEIFEPEKEIEGDYALSERLAALRTA